MGHRGIICKVPNEHVIGYVLVGQNGRFTHIYYMNTIIPNLNSLKFILPSSGVLVSYQNCHPQMVFLTKLGGCQW